MPLETRAQVKELSTVERELSIVIPGDQVAKELDKAYQRLSQKVRLKGFRQGKVPRYVLEQYYKQQTEADVLERIVGQSYREAVESHKLQPVSQPSIEARADLIPGMDFSYQARVEVKPAIELKEYKGLTLTKKVYEASDQMVQQELDSLRERFVKVVPVEDRDVVQQGDLVQCNFSGTVDGEHVKGLGGVSFIVEVGAGRFYPEAEQALVGKKTSENFDVEITVPEDFRVESVRGKKAVLSMRPEQLKRKDVPPLDDEFAKDVSDEHESLDDLKKSIKERLERQMQARTRAELRDAAVEALIEKNPFEVPGSLVDRQAEQVAANALGRLPPEAADRLWASQRQRLTEDARPRALKQVRAGFLLENIVEREGIKVDEDDVEEYLKTVASDSGRPLGTLKNLYKRGSSQRDALKDQIITEKALELVIESAQVAEEKSAG
jgi:trigger factor